MIVSLIAAVAENGVIGRGGRLPWRLSADLRRFKSLTMGHPIIMGRNTFESIGKPLPGRKNIILTTNNNFNAEGVTVVHSIEDALRAIEDPIETFICGGAEVYAQFLPIASRMYLTIISSTFDGNVYFPDYDHTQWAVKEATSYNSNDKDLFPYTFFTLERKTT